MKLIKENLQWMRINEEFDLGPYGFDGKSNHNRKKDYKEKIGQVFESTPEELFNNLFTIRQIAHDYHLKKQLGNHLALEFLYEKILKLTDELFETYMGQYGVLENYQTTIQYEASDDIASLIEEHLDQFKEDRYLALSKEDTHLQNICDEIVSVTYRTLYKLKYLKTEGA